MRRGVIFTIEMALVLALMLGTLGLLIPLLKVPEKGYTAGYERGVLAVIEKSGMLQECGEGSCAKLQEYIEMHDECIELEVYKYDENGAEIGGWDFQGGICPANPSRVVSTSRVSWRDTNTYVSRIKVSR